MSHKIQPFPTVKCLSFLLGYSMEELAMYRPAVFGNAIQGLIIILRAMVQLNINFVQAERLADVREFFSIVAM